MAHQLHAEIPFQIVDQQKMRFYTKKGENNPEIN